MSRPFCFLKTLQLSVKVEQTLFWRWMEKTVLSWQVGCLSANRYPILADKLELKIRQQRISYRSFAFFVLYQKVLYQKVEYRKLLQRSWIVL